MEKCKRAAQGGGATSITPGQSNGLIIIDALMTHVDVCVMTHDDHRSSEPQKRMMTHDEEATENLEKKAEEEMDET